MLIFSLVIGMGLIGQGAAAVGNLYRWRGLSVTPSLRRTAGVTYLSMGAMFMLGGFWRPFYIGALLSLVVLVVIQRKIVIQRRIGTRSGS